jgi:multicomponent Na+:H+ antiporter subunit A
MADEDTDTSVDPHGRPRRDWQGWSCCVVAAVGFVVCLVGWLRGGGTLSLPWAPTLDVRLEFAFDGLAALYALLATGVGAVVFGYGARYLSQHLAEHGRARSERWRFWPWMALFAVAMVGLATATDLVLVFVFFDLTAVCSYFLIGFDRERREARTAALTALLVTIVPAVALLAGAVLLFATYGTFSVPELVERVEPGTTTTVAGLLIAVAALAKSAQVPLHFWLPRAMEAPTPVSAYLHSAAMVAAGVLVLGRVHPLLARSDVVLTVLLVVGLASIAVGGVLALGRDELKQVLAYSTISQYGYVVALYGMVGAAASGAAAFYVIVHALAKSALFLSAGAVTSATGEDRLSHLGGLGRRLPLLAGATGVAAATLAALPLTGGFFSDELFFGAAKEQGPVLVVAAVLAAALTFAYIGRYWMRLFLGPMTTAPAALSRVLVVPVVLLALVALVVGVLPAPVTQLAEDAGAVSHAGPVALSPAYHLDLRATNVMALAAWALGGLLLAAPRLRDRASSALAAAGDRLGPRRAYTASVLGLRRWSGRVHDWETRDLRSSIAAVLVPAGALAAAAFAATPIARAYSVGPISGTDWLVLPLLALTGVATVVAARTRERLSIVLALSAVGFALAAVYALRAAPDVGLVAVLVETMLTLVFLAALARLPGTEPRRERGPRAGRRWRDPVIGAIAGLGAFAVIWGYLSEPREAPSVSADQIRLTPAAHGQDVVTVIVADFRGLDTLGEITVLLIAAVGVATLLRRGRLW